MNEGLDSFNDKIESSDEFSENLSEKGKKVLFEYFQKVKNIENKKVNDGKVSLFFNKSK